MTSKIVIEIAKFLKSLENKEIPYNIIKNALIPLRNELMLFKEAREILEVK